MTSVIYVSGRFFDEQDARIRFDDRGFIFADSLYEVIRYYSGRPFRIQAHLRRLCAGAEEIGLSLPETIIDAEPMLDELIGRNHAEGTDFSIYLQVTRGAEGRAHVFPAQAIPTVVAWILPVSRPTEVVRSQTAITVKDRRWSMCHLKTTGLMLNVLAKQQAAEAAADEAIFVRDDVVTEGTMSNFFGVRAGIVITHPEGPHILSGITRAATLEVLAEQGTEVKISPLLGSEIESLDEAFITGTGCEVAAIVEIDGQPVGDGRPGPVAIAAFDGFRQMATDPRGLSVAPPSASLREGRVFRHE